MSTQQTFDQQRQRPSTECGRDIIFTAQGSKRASRRVWRTGAKLGYESQNYRPPADLPVEFVDWPFSKLDDFPNIGELFDHHLKVVRAERPELAVAPDIDERVPYRDAIEYADQLSEYADTVIVVPKTVMPEEVPARFRVGMPCQERYGPTPWQWTDYRPVPEVHLLGGSPVKHREILKYFVPVESLDTSLPVQSAKYGSYWNGEKWAKGDHGFYGSLERSYRSIRAMMNKDRRHWDPRARNRKHDYESAFRELDNTGLFDHDNPPRPPRAAHYECNNPRELAKWVLNRV